MTMTDSLLGFNKCSHLFQMKDLLYDLLLLRSHNMEEVRRSSQLQTEMSMGISAKVKTSSEAVERKETLRQEFSLRRSECKRPRPTRLVEVHSSLRSLKRILC